MKYDLFELSVAVPSRHGNTKIPEYGKQGLSYVEGRKNQQFVVKLRNDSAQRVLAILSIDGINVVDGQPCTPQSRGYVVPAYSTVDIEGWRTSLSEIHKFQFKDKAGAYAKSVTGETQNCGVIAVKFFSEKPSPNLILQALQDASKVEEHHHHHHYHDYPRQWPWWPYHHPYEPIWMTCTSGAGNLTSGYSVPLTACNAAPPVTLSNGAGNTVADISNSTHEGPVSVNTMQTGVPDFTLGTGWGDTKTDCVAETAFERDRELCTLTLYYAEAACLEKIGIMLAKDLAVTPSASPVLPQAFSGFCKPPVSR